MQKQNGEFNYEEYLYEKNYSNLETCLSSDRDIGQLSVFWGIHRKYQLHLTVKRPAK